jgi:hypothetical protein
MLNFVVIAPSLIISGFGVAIGRVKPLKFAVLAALKLNAF